jgi:16S rRNA (adenine1518-N6/adenine1519-N6)-dimethyltransferase
MNSRPKKRLGQHFLVDGNIIRKIMDVAAVRAGEDVLEVGPGRGVLTDALLDAGANVLAVEFDKDLAEGLKKRFKDNGNFEILIADAVRLDYTEIARERGCKFKVVSNLPYNISGPIIARFLQDRDSLTALILMLQREVALRLVAKPGTKDYGALTVLTQSFTEPVLEFNVSPESFRPRPKVSSSVVRLDVLPEPRVVIEDEAFFKTVVRASFGQRRKTLLNALKVLGLNSEGVKEALALASIDAGRRGETLSLEEFSKLAEELGRIKEE